MLLWSTFNADNNKHFNMSSISEARENGELHANARRSRAATSVPITSANRAHIPSTTPGKTQLMEEYAPDAGAGLYARLYEKTRMCPSSTGLPAWSEDCEHSVIISHSRAGENWMFILICMAYCQHRREGCPVLPWNVQKDFKSPICTT